MALYEVVGGEVCHGVWGGVEGEPSAGVGGVYLSHDKDLI